MINVYGKERDFVEMLSLFRQMLVSADDVQRNSVTMVCLLSACSALCNYEVGRFLSVFIHVNKIHLNANLVTDLIYMYFKCGDLKKAQRFFDGVSCRKLPSWNAMITGYVQRGLLEKEIDLYRRMKALLVKPNEITLVNVLSACASLGNAMMLGLAYNGDGRDAIAVFSQSRGVG